MADNGLVVIEGKREDWPGGPRSLTPRDPFREPNGQAFWCGAELDPDGCQVWFRIVSADVHWMRAETPEARGDHLIDALLTWMTPQRQLRPELNRFDVRLSDDGAAWIERLRW